MVGARDFMQRGVSSESFDDPLDQNGFGELIACTLYKQHRHMDVREMVRALGLVSVYRPVASSSLDGYRQPSSASACTVVVGAMFIGPIILLVVVPARQTYFLGNSEAIPPGQHLPIEL